MPGTLRGLVAAVVVTSSVLAGAGTAHAVTFPIGCRDYGPELSATLTADMPPTVGPTKTFTVANIVGSAPNVANLPATVTNLYYEVGIRAHVQLVAGSVQAPAGAVVRYEYPNGFRVTFPGPYSANPGDPTRTMPPVSASFVADKTDGATLGLQVSALGLTAQVGSVFLYGSCFPVLPGGGLPTIASTTIVNQPPAANAISKTLAATDSVTIATADLASDPDDGIDPASFAVTQPPTHGTASFDASGLHYTPNADFVQDQLQFKVCDTIGACSTGSFLATVPGKNPPVAKDDTLTVQQGQTGAVNVLANDSAADNPIDASSLSIVANPSRGQAAIGTDHSTISYTPTDGFSGSDSVIYRICDTTGLCAQAKLGITVTATAKTAPPDIPLPPTTTKPTTTTAPSTTAPVVVVAGKKAAVPATRSRGRRTVGPQLARTGPTSTGPIALVGLALVTMGLVFAVSGRRRLRRRRFC